MWKVGDVEPVRVMGAEGYPYGFNVTTEDGKPVVSFAYASRALAEAAATHLESALLNAISVLRDQIVPHAGNLRFTKNRRRLGNAASGPSEGRAPLPAWPTPSRHSTHLKLCLGRNRSERLIER